MSYAIKDFFETLATYRGGGPKFSVQTFGLIVRSMLTQLLKFLLVSLDITTHSRNTPERARNVVNFVE
jgi:hypothetical protein